MSKHTSIISNLTNSMAIVHMLFEGEIRRMSRSIEELVKANDRLLNIPPSVGFLFNGDYYVRNADVNLPAFGERHPLHEDLWDQMQTYHLEMSKLMLNIDLVNQMCHRLVKDCVTTQDLRDALPDCLISLSPEAMKLTRTRPEAFTLEDDEREKRQYAKVKPLIEFYSATRMMY